MLRPFLPFRAKPLKKAMAPKTYAFDQRGDLNIDEILVTIKAQRHPVKFARLQVSPGRKILSRNDAAHS